MTPQFQTIRKILDLAAQDGRVEQAIEELEKFAELRFCEAFKYIEYCMNPSDFFDENGKEITKKENIDPRWDELKKLLTDK